MPPVYQIHPLFVHFPIALLLAGAFFKVLAEWKKNSAFQTSSLWLLRLGCPAALAAAALGLLAAKTVPHVPAAWETMYDHKVLGLCLAGTSVALWMAEELGRRNPKPWMSWLSRLLWLAAAVLVIAAGSEGGELVYTYGVAVATAPHL